MYTIMHYGFIFSVVYLVAKAIVWRYKNREYFRFKKRMEREVAHYMWDGEY